MDYVFDHHGCICHVGHFAQHRLDFELAGSTNFRMVVFDCNAHLFKFKAGFASAFVCIVKRFCNMIVLLMRYYAAFALSCTVPV